MPQSYSEVKKLSAVEIWTFFCPQSGFEPEDSFLIRTNFSESVFVNFLRSPGIDCQPGEPVRQPYLSYRPARLIRLAESIPRNRFVGSLCVTNTGSYVVIWIKARRSRCRCSSISSRLCLAAALLGMEDRVYLKGQCHEIFDFKFFHESASPMPRVPHQGRFDFFQKFAEIFTAQGAPPVSNGKSLQSERF
jgi:hypothetical protein